MYVQVLIYPYVLDHFLAMVLYHLNYCTLCYDKYTLKHCTYLKIYKKHVNTCDRFGFDSHVMTVGEKVFGK